MPLEQFRTPGGKSVWLHIRPDTNDHNTAWSCLNENEYQLPPLSGMAWDIGAHIGSATVAMALDNPELHVIAVEPVPDNLLAASRNFQTADIRKRVTLIAGAVGKGDVVVRYGYIGSEHATHHAFIGNMSTLVPTDATDSVTYAGLTVAMLLDWHGVPSLVKIDTEGGEWSFFDTDDTRLLPLIVGEWHPGGGTQAEFRALLPHHDVTFTGPVAGPGGFRAVLRG